MHLVWASQKLSHSDIYFSNGSHFSYLLNVSLLSTLISTGPLYLAQLYIFSGAIHTQKNYGTVAYIIKIFWLMYNEIIVLGNLSYLFDKDIK